jgi:hypothetical protein
VGLGALRALADHENLGKTTPRSRLIPVLPVADLADSFLLCSPGRLNELACVVLGLLVASLWVVEEELVRSYGLYHLPAIVATIVEV